MENGSEYIYTYGAKPHAVRSVGNIAFQYDLNGNMTQKVGAGVTITIASQNWNYENKPTLLQKGSATTSLTYDGNGQRVRKVSSLSGTTLYYGELYETRAGVGTIHLFAGSNRVASILLDGRTQFYHTDHLGSASVITDSNGNRKEQIVYFPFGSYRAAGNINGTYDYDASFPDVFYTFTGQEDDDDLGFYNYGARLYDPALGRFISPDTMVPDPSDPQSLNRYSYTLNNPLRYIDPTGNQYCEGDWSEDFWEGSIWGSSWGYSWGHSFGLRFVPPPRYNWRASGGNTGTFYGNLTLDINIPDFSSSFSKINLLNDAENNPVIRIVETKSYREIGLLMRMLASEGSKEYKIEGLLEGIGWTVPNRIELRPKFYGSTYEEVIYKLGQYQGLHLPEGIKFGDWERPLNPIERKVHEKALSVAVGVYYGTISDPTQGATHFHYGPPNEKWQNWTNQGRFIFKGQIGSFYFYREVWP